MYQLLVGTFVASTVVLFSIFCLPLFVGIVRTWAKLDYINLWVAFLLDFSICIRIEVMNKKLVFILCKTVDVDHDWIKSVAKKTEKYTKATTTTTTITNQIYRTKRTSNSVAIHYLVLVPLFRIIQHVLWSWSDNSSPCVQNRKLYQRDKMGTSWE